MSEVYVCPDNLPRPRQQRMRRPPHVPFSDLERQQLAALAEAIIAVFRQHGLSQRMRSHAEAIQNFARTAPKSHRAETRRTGDDGLSPISNAFDRATLETKQ